MRRLIKEFFRIRPDFIQYLTIFFITRALQRNTYEFGALIASVLF
jgi:hypothetical protein